MMHPGVKKQALDMQRRFEIDQISLYSAIKNVRKGCSVCQACHPDNRNVQGEAQWTPVPDQPMESVAMDVSSMPKVHIGKETFDCVVLCVDRHSGYVVAVPARKRGWLAKEGAVMMIGHWLTVCDIPRPICSDRGPQFTGGWFKAMCSLMGIHHAKSVAYLSRSNGRAEVAGRQLFEKLRKSHITNPHRNWFEEMWPALKAHHDTPPPGGLSPHQILFGRDPLGRGLPLSVDGMALDAKEFFARQEATARDIRQQLEKEHAERQKSAPSSTAQTFRVGDPLWVISESQVHVSLCWTPNGSHMEWRIRSPRRRGNIPLGVPMILGHFEQPKCSPFGTPISAPRVVNWRPHICMPMGSPDPISFGAARYMSQVLPPLLWIVGLALVGRITRGNDANFSDSGIMTPLGEPVGPDAGISEGTRFW